MSAVEFHEELKRLKAVYGDRAFPQARADLIWNEFKGESAYIFSCVVSRLIADYRSSPVLSDFRIERAKEREFFSSREKKNLSNKAYAPDENGVTYAEYVHRCVNENRQEELKELVKLFGVEKIDEMYERGLKEKQTGIPDNTNVSLMFSGKL